MIFWKKKEKPVNVKPVAEYDPMDAFQLYVDQLRTDHNYGRISDDEYNREVNRIRDGVKCITNVLHECPDLKNAPKEFQDRVHSMMGSIMNGEEIR